MPARTSVEAENAEMSLDEPEMKYLLLMNYRVDGVPPMNTLAEQDVRAHVQFQIALHKRLTYAGELVDVAALETPELARLVTLDGRGASAVTAET